MPSITIWSRLEPRSREFSMERALQAQVRDPLWLLARQWQVAEFGGDDAGSPVLATVRTESAPLTSYRAGPSGTVGDIAADLPLEVQVEREEPVLGVRAAVALGRHLEAILADEGAGAHAGAFRGIYRIAGAPPSGEVADVATQRFRTLAAGRAVDGAALLDAARAHAANLAGMPPIPSLPTAAARAAAVRAVRRLVDLAAGLYSQPDGDRAWQPLHLEHAFAAGAETDTSAVALEAPHWGGGTLDWFAFGLGERGLRTPAGTPSDVRDHAFIPAPVSFRGMPASRWWDFEDGLTDFGRLDVEHVDLAKLVVMEFVLVYGDDWFELPLPLPAGTLSHVDTLLVTDTFGERTLIRPTAEQLDDGERWAMFGLTGAPQERDLMLLAPALEVVQDGPVLEDVLMLRDEMAAMAWGVERSLHGGLDAPVDGYTAFLRRHATAPPPPLTREPGGPAVSYLLGTEVPGNWIPLVPVRTSERSFLFRRGVMGSPGAEPARGMVLEPWHPFYVADEAIPRSGVRVTRRFHRARWSDGSTLTWLARRAQPGLGPGASGLAFDTLLDLPEQGS